MAMTLLATSNPNSVDTTTFSNISQNYKDLKVFFTLRFDGRATEDSLRLTFNGNSSNYEWRLLRGDGSSTTSTSGSGSEIQFGWILGTNATSNTFSNGQINVGSYTASVNKLISADNVPETNSSSALYATLCAGAWNNTSAITSLTISAGSTFTGSIWLYGIS